MENIDSYSEADVMVGSLFNESTVSEPTFSVSEINEAISEAINTSFPKEVWVKGEIQRLNFHSSGHIYFNLCDSAKNSNSTIPVSLFKFSASKIKADLREVLAEDREVRLKVKPNFYAPYGKMSLVVSDVDTDFTLGQIAIARRKLLEKLEREGILRANAVHDIDELPLNLVLITALDSAAYHDVTDQLKASSYGFKIKVINALMQGAESIESVTKALNFANTLEADVVLLCRGGGAKSDLSSFDSEPVARAICEMDSAVITGLGHQIDVSVADVVAHSSFKTPTACAQFLIDKVCESVEVVEQIGQQIASRVNENLHNIQTNLGFLTQRLSDSENVLDKYLLHIESIERTIKVSFNNQLSSVAKHLLATKQVVRAHDPQRVLERGYSLTTDDKGKVIRNKKDIEVNKDIFTKLADAELVSTVKEIKEK